MAASRGKHEFTMTENPRPTGPRHGVKWPYVALVDVATIDRRAKGPEEVHQADLYVGLGNITNGGQFQNVRTAGEAGLKSNKFLFTRSHVLYGKLRPYLSKIAAPEFEGICSTDILPIRPGPNLDRRYLLHYLRTPELLSHAASKAVGINLPRLSPNVLELFQIPLPSIEEQRRIAAVLDAAEALQAKRRQAINVLDSLTQAIFTDMFGDPVQDETITRLGECVDLYSGSTLPEGEEFEGQVSGYALVKVSDLARDGNEKFINSTREWTPVKGPSASTCPSGSIVFPKRGAAIAKNRKRITTIPSVLDPNLMGVTPKSHSLTLPYLYAWFERLDLQSIQSGSSVPQLNKKDLAPLELKLPRVENQIKFAQLVGNVDSARAHMVQQLQQLDILFASLQQRAFRGDL